MFHLRNAAALVAAVALTLPVASAGAAAGDPGPAWSPASGDELRTAAHVPPGSADRPAPERGGLAVAGLALALASGVRVRRATWAGAARPAEETP